MLQQQPQSIAIVLDKEQIDAVASDLINSKSVGANSAIIMVTPYPEDREQLREGKLPKAAPQIIVFDTVFTIGLEQDVEEILRMVGEEG